MNFSTFGRQARGRGARGGGVPGRRGGRGGGGRHHGNNFGRNNRPNNGSVNNKNFSHVHFIETTGAMTSSCFTIAIQGCSHGELDCIYDALEAYRLNSDVEKATNIDVLLCCGDVQPLRNESDYHALAVPQKYKAMGDFHAYYSGEKVAPILTVMVGGNHESSNYLQELYYGGWVAPNIYYLGAAGAVNLCKFSSDGTSISTIRIAGLSGIYKSHDFNLGRFEAPPYSPSELRSVYHTRLFEVERLRGLSSFSAASGAQLKSTTDSINQNMQPIDIMISHDWPRGIEQHGNLPQLLQRKPFFKEEILTNSLGSPASESLLHSLKPRYWFAAHLHVKFEATVRHGSNGSDDNNGSKETPSRTPDQNESTTFVGMESNEGICPDSTDLNMESLTDQMTRFLSLDKCLPKRRHLQIMHVEPSFSRATPNGQTLEGENNSWLEYDPAWLAIHRRTEEWSQRTHHRVQIPTDSFDQNPISNDEVEDVLSKLKIAAATRSKNQSTCNPLAIPKNFVQTVRPHDPRGWQQPPSPPLPMVGNPQTDAFLDMLGMSHKLTTPFCNNRAKQAPDVPFAMPDANDDNEIDIDDVADGDKYATTIPRLRAPLRMPAPSANDDNEIDLDADEHFADREVNVAKEVDNHTTMKDPEEIELDDIEDARDVEAGDSVCYTPSDKKPRV